jgi:hypothetical protein
MLVASLGCLPAMRSRRGDRHRAVVTDMVGPAASSMVLESVGTAAIFIGYRESDAKAYAIAVRDVLEAAFGEDALFLDKDTLTAGAWAPQLSAGIARCRVFVLVIGRHWLDARAASGERRLADADDVHRHEIALALATPSVTVLPLLVDGATLPAADDLPTDLRPLAAQQAYTWDDSARRRAVDRMRLVAAVERLSGLRAVVPSPHPGWLAPTGAALALTAAAATASSMASMQLGGRELVVVLVVALCVSFGARTLWQRVRGHP